MENQKNFDEAAERDAFRRWFENPDDYRRHSIESLCERVWLAAKQSALKADPEPQEKPAKYLIWNGGYVGNAMVWWRPEGRGYTTDIDGAGRFDEAEARSIIKNSKHTAFPEDYILDGSRGRIKRIVDSQYVNREMALK